MGGTEHVCVLPTQSLWGEGRGQGQGVKLGLGPDKIWGRGLVHPCGHPFPCTRGRSLPGASVHHPPALHSLWLSLSPSLAPLRGTWTLSGASLGCIGRQRGQSLWGLCAHPARGKVQWLLQSRGTWEPICVCGKGRLQLHSACSMPL